MGSKIIPMLVSAIGIVAVGVAVFFAIKGNNNKPSPENKGDSPANSKVDTEKNSNSDENTPDSHIKTKINIPSDDDQSEAAVIVDNKGSALMGSSDSENSSDDKETDEPLLSAGIISPIVQKKGDNNELPSGGSSNPGHGPENIASMLGEPSENSERSVPMQAPLAASRANVPVFCAAISEKKPVTVLCQDCDDSDNSDPEKTIKGGAAADLLRKDVLQAKIPSPPDGDRINFPALFPYDDVDGCWEKMYQCAQYLKKNHIEKVGAYIGVDYDATNLIVTDLRAALQCLQLKDDFPDIFKIDLGECSIHRVIFYDIRTENKMNTEEVIAMDTSDQSGDFDEFLNHLGMEFQKEANSVKFHGQVYVKVPFKNSLQKKIVIRCLQKRFVEYLSQAVC